MQNFNSADNRLAYTIVVILNTIKYNLSHEFCSFIILWKINTACLSFNFFSFNPMLFVAHERTKENCRFLGGGVTNTPCIPVSCSDCKKLKQRSWEVEASHSERLTACSTSTFCNLCFTFLQSLQVAVMLGKPRSLTLFINCWCLSFFCSSFNQWHQNGRKQILEFSLDQLNYWHASRRHEPPWAALLFFWLSLANPGSIPVQIAYKIWFYRHFKETAVSYIEP